MSHIAVTDRSGTTRRIDITPGLTLMETIRDAGMDDLFALCGGCLSCATCHVFIEPDWLARLPAMQSDEDDLLDCSSYRRGNSRLSCQIPVSEELNGLAVTIAPED